MGSYTQEARHLELATVLGPDALIVRGFSGWEGLSRPFLFDLDLVSENDSIDLRSLTGTNVTLRVSLADGSPRYWNGHISRMSQGWKGRTFTAYRAEMVPWLWFLGLKSDCRIFQNKTTRVIVEDLFKELGFHDYDAGGVHNEFPAREYCVQYRETDLQFVGRLLEEDGIFYFFKHENGKHTLMLANTPDGHPDCPNQSSVRCRATAGSWRTEDVITDWRMDEEMVPSSSAVADYNFQTPTTQLGVALTGKDQFEIYHHPGIYTDTGQGRVLARLRMEEASLFASVARGESTCRSFTSGYRFKLDEHYREDWKQWYVLTEIRHHATQGGGGLGSGDDSRGDEPAYQNEFTCIPYATPFRPPRRTPVPVVEGCQTAVVVGPPGEEIYTDEHGRVKVQFHWDRLGQKNENSSCWIRVSQNWAGQGWGAISIPRIGQEVIVDFLEGNPDRPIIVGRVYNADQIPPYNLPSECTKTTLKSCSSKGGGGFNELRFEDAKGKEQVFIHAERNQDIRVNKDMFENVGEHSHRMVGQDHREKVSGDKHLTVGGDQNEKIDGTVSLKAGVDYQAVVGMRYAVKAGTEVHQTAGVNFVVESGTTLTLKVGSSFVNLNPSGVYISGPRVMINSGGAPGAGAGASPQTPKLPVEADRAQGGKTTPGKPPKPPKPTTYSATAVVMRHAAQRGTPFCDI